MSEENIKLFSPRSSLGAAGGDGDGGAAAAAGGSAAAASAAAAAAAARAAVARAAAAGKPALQRRHSFGAVDTESLPLQSSKEADHGGSTPGGEHGGGIGAGGHAGMRGRGRAGSRACQLSEKAFERWYFEYMDRLLDNVIERRVRRRQKQLADAADAAAEGTGRTRAAATR